MRFETLAVHAGLAVDPATGAVAPPIQLTTTFQRDPDGSFPHGNVYVRNSNPNRTALEECLRLLEGGAAAAAFASGSAATAAVLQALAPGDHVLAPSDAYTGTGRLLRDLARWGVETSFVDMTNVDAVRAAVRPATKLVWIETPSNPLWKVTDIARIAEIARAAGARSLCDNTVATPVLQSPLALGVDLAKHATTKYLAGHTDVQGGAVVARVADDFFQRVEALRTSGGAVPSPFDCWLVRRGIRTLAVRMRAHSEHALAVARFLHDHPRVEAVHYPGLPDHPAHAVAVRQMRAFSGMLSVQVRGGRDAAMAVAAKVRVFTRATSYGGTESLLEHRASIEGAGTRTPDNLLRVSIGLEHPDDLIDDLSQALG